MNLIVYVVLGAAVTTLFVMILRSLKKPDPLLEMTRSNRLARPGDEPVFLVRTDAKDREAEEEAAEPALTVSSH